MSLYNIVFGKSKHSTLLLAALGLTERDFYRYRDCYLDEHGRIAVYTRGGGGNRNCWCEESEDRGDLSVGEPHAASCVVVLQARNRRHPQYLRDTDDDFDSTYATFYFAVPESLPREALAVIEPEMSRNEQWQVFLDALKAGK